MTEDVRLPDVGRRLSAARLQLGLSQGTVARLAGVAPSYLSRIETGKIQPRFRTVVRIVQALHVDLADLMEPGPRHDDARGRCPISRSGRCLLDLISHESGMTRSPGREAYSPCQIRVLREFTTWVRHAPPDRVRAAETLLADLANGKLY